MKPVPVPRHGQLIAFQLFFFSVWSCTTLLVICRFLCIANVRICARLIFINFWVFELKHRRRYCCRRCRRFQCSPRWKANETCSQYDHRNDKNKIVLSIGYGAEVAQRTCSVLVWFTAKQRAHTHSVLRPIEWRKGRRSSDRFILLNNGKCGDHQAFFAIFKWVRALSIDFISIASFLTKKQTSKKIIFFIPSRKLLQSLKSL